MPSEDAQAVIDEIAAIDENILVADGFEEALIGYAGVNGCTVALYDRDKCLSILVKRDAMTYVEAEEFFEYNVEGAYVGPNTPLFATILRRNQWEDT
jgi:hypothetical protein